MRRFSIEIEEIWPSFWLTSVEDYPERIIEFTEEEFTEYQRTCELWAKWQQRLRDAAEGWDE